MNFWALRPISRLVIGVLFICSCQQIEKKPVESRIDPDSLKIKASVPATEHPLVQDTCVLPEGWVLLESDSEFVVDLPYATTNNFTKTLVYPCMKCLVREKIAKKLDLLRPLLKQDNLKLVLRDCYRNTESQAKLWRAKPDARFVKPPWRGSNHSRGIALDVELINSNNELLDMGTSYDDFTQRSYINSDEISLQQSINRNKLKAIMKSVGFTTIRTEWWHFDGGSSKNAKLEEIQLPCNCIAVQHSSQQ